MNDHEPIRIGARKDSKASPEPLNTEASEYDGSMFWLGIASLYVVGGIGYAIGYLFHLIFS